MKTESDVASAPATRGRTLDHAAGLYDWLSPAMMFWQEGRLGREAQRLLALRGDERVLDVGCATGWLTRRIAAALTAPDACAVGLDAAPKMIAAARRKAAGQGRLRFDVGVAERLEYAAGSFDCAISTFFFHHVDAELKRKALAEMHRVVKPDGRIAIVDVDVPEGVLGRICAWSGYWLFKQEEIRENIRGDLRRALAEAPFREVERVSRHFGYISVFRIVN